MNARNLSQTFKSRCAVANVHHNTVWRAENGKTEPGPAVAKIIAALEAHGVEFVGRRGVRLKRRT